MRRCPTLLGVLVIATLLVPAVMADNRGVSFTGIGFIENPGTRPASNVMAMNPEGTVFLVSPNSSGGGYAVYWTREDGWGEHVGALGGGSLRLSSDGTILGNGVYPGSSPAYAWPGLWTGVLDVWDPIPSDDGYVACGSSRLTGYDMGGNGDFIAGLTWQGCTVAQGFLWDQATDTTISLGRPNGKSTRANAVTADGSAVIGWGTMAQGLRRGARWEDGTWTFLGDPNGTEPKICSQSGGACTFNGTGTNGCPEYVDDGTCANRGTCMTGACVGGSNPGAMCTSNNQCAGTCTGPNAGATCTSAGACPDTLVCINNPDWNAGLFKGEAYDVTDDGQHAVGRQICYPDGSCPSNSGYVSNPDGTFTEIPPPADFPNLVDMFRISQDGKTTIGRAGSFFTGVRPIFWNEALGTQELQLFLVQQGLDELFFWTLADLTDVSADGTVIAGRGVNPEGWLEGFVVDMNKLWVCHAPSGTMENARTLGVEFGSAGDHLAHGDFLGTCEFLNSGGLSRAAELSERLNALSAVSAGDDPITSALGGRDWSATPAERPQPANGELPRRSARTERGRR